MSIVPFLLHYSLFLDGWTWRTSKYDETTTTRRRHGRASKFNGWKLKVTFEGEYFIL